jgi:Fe-S-cluster containining protein
VVYQAQLTDGRALDRTPAMMCPIHEVRPLICREFEMGEPDCVDERDKWFIKLN